MIEQLITARLKTITPNVFPTVAPTTYKTPCVVYHRFNTETIKSLDPGAKASFVVFQFAVSSPDFIEAKSLATEIRDSLLEWDDEDELTPVSWINEVSGIDNSTDTVLHRVLVFIKFYCAE